MLKLLSGVVHDHEGDLGVETRLVPHIMANFRAILSIYGSACRIPKGERECVGKIGELLYRLGRWNDEHEVYMYLKQITKLVLGREYPLTLGSINNLAEVLREQGKYT